MCPCRRSCLWMRKTGSPGLPVTRDTADGRTGILLKACRGVVRAGGRFPASALCNAHGRGPERRAVSRVFGAGIGSWQAASLPCMRKNMAGSGAPALFLVFLHKGGFPGSERRDFSAWTARKGPFSRKRACRRPCRGVCRSRLCHESSAPCRACSSAHGRTLQVPSSPPGDGRGGRKRLRPPALEGYTCRRTGKAR